ncbi:uncharacterized protein [Oscarella lobularis]|uniref:uncharacterized protein n=1 Tax=Oscarella lobularis TaxID=121494 RepID=UPI0033131553
MLTLAFALLLCGAVAAASSISGALKLNADDVAFTTSPSFVSFNFDWWPNGTPAWTNSSVLIVNLTNPLLVYLTSQLSPGHLRIGGTDEDRIVFDIGDSHQSCVDPFCLRMSRWKELINFTQVTGTKLAFGINAMYGRKNRSSHFDPSNAEALMKYTAQEKLPVAAFEFGNELNHGIDPQVYGEDFATMRKMINEIWPDESNRPQLVGPDIGTDSSYFEDFLPVAGPYLNATTYHIYAVGRGTDADLPAHMASLKYLQRQTDEALSMLAIVKKTAPNSELWLGEGAAASHSGLAGATNTFLSGFWYMNALGTTATHGHTALCRQALVGGNYELLNKTTFMPNPDYYTALLYRRLMGQKMLEVTVSSNINDSFAAYAACANQGSPGEIVVAFLNLNTTESIEISLTGIASGPREEFHLTTGEEGNYRSQEMLLNGNLLQIKDGKLPNLSGMNVTGDTPLVAQPMSYGFALYKSAAANACM